MAETPKVVNPNKTKEVQTVETPEVKTPTPPVEEVKQEVIETPVAPVLETPQVAETPEITQNEPVITQPVVETPDLTQETEEIKTVETQAPKTTVGKVETAQDIKTQEIANEDLTNELNEKKKTQAVTEMQQLVNNGATTEQIGKFGLKNIQFKDDLNVVLKSAFKNKDNAMYFGKYSTMSNENMYAEYTAGNVTPGSEQYNLLPAEKKASFDNYLKLKQEASITKKTDFTYAKNSMDMSGLEAEVPKMFSSNVRENYQKALNSPEIIKLSSEMAQKQVEMETIDIELETLQEDMEKQLAGNLGGSISAEIRQKYNMKVRDKRLKLAEYNAALGQFNSLKANAETELKISMYEDTIAREEYNTQLSLYETRRKEARQDQIAIANAESEAQAAKIKRQQEIEDMMFLEKNKQIAAEKSYVNQKELLKYKNDIEKGNIKGEWENRFDGLYFLQDNGTAKKVINGSLSVDEDGTSVYTSLDANGKPIVEVYDVEGNPVGANTNGTQLSQEQVDLLNAPAGSVIPTRLKEVSKNNINRGKECAEYVNDIFGTSMGNSYQSKLNVATEKSGGLGSLAVWQPNPGDSYYSKFGHAGVIVGESEDGKAWHIKSSNFSGDGTISVDEVPKEAIEGYKSTSIYNKPIEEKEYSIAQNKYLEEINLDDYNSKKEVKSVADGLGLTEEDIFTYKATKIVPTAKQDFQELLTTIDSIRNAGGGDGLSDALGVFSTARLFKNTSESSPELYFPGTDAADFESEVNKLLSKQILTNLDKMSGVLTDKDLQVLQNAESSLSFNMSEKAFKKELDKLESAIKNSLKKFGELGNDFYTDPSGKKWSKEGIANELVRLQESGLMSSDDIKQYIKENNLKFN